MPTIVVSPVLVGEEDPQFSYEVINLRVVVQESVFAGVFDQLEIWRSRNGEAGPFEEATAGSWLPARVPAGAPDAPATPETGRSAALSGLSLELLVKGSPLSVTFSGGGPLTYAAAASQVNVQGAGQVAAYVAGDGTFVLQTVGAGTEETLQVLESEAAPLLGLPTTEPGSLAFGRDTRISLRHGVEEYLFTDLRGARELFYKTRFRNRNTGATSEFSQVYSVGQAIGLGDLVCGKLELVGLDGRPLANHSVVVFNRLNFALHASTGKLVASQTLSKLTDRNGAAQFFLVRGVKVTVSIPGTDIVRDITVPTDPAVKVFGLLDAAVGDGDDVFKVQVPDIIYAERRSL